MIKVWIAIIVDTRLDIVLTGIQSNSTWKRIDVELVGLGMTAGQVPN